MYVGSKVIHIALYYKTMKFIVINISLKALIIDDTYVSK